MKRKNYNLELIRLISFVLVIVIHVTNYFCRAYGKISGGEYLFSLALDTAARVSVPCFFMITGALLVGRDEPLAKHGRRLLRFLVVLIVWSAVYYFWNTFYMGTPCDLAAILDKPTEEHLWLNFLINACNTCHINDRIISGILPKIYNNQDKRPCCFCGIPVYALFPQRI